MNNLKKTVFALGLGILAFGFSAFKTKEKSSVYIYYKVNYSTYPAANNPNGYMYYSADHCEAGGTLCSAQWDIGSSSAPTDGDPLPLTGVTFITNSVITGHFE
ncbi:hypothetical protein [Pedobacter sp. GR22-6]|uniref:hypothetical protein n=1 Tax=Pedobacter sp. GR22-6 TaxID=3127957 RepID=UPI00307FAF16